MDILICTVPGTFSERPPLAPAILKACVESAGFSASVIDLNIEINNKIRFHPNKDLLQAFLTSQIIADEVTSDIGDLIEYCAHRIINTDVKTIGLSLLTQDNQFFTIWLCYYLKILKPSIKIVIGGSGIKNFIAQSNITFAEMLKEKKFIDDYINGDGEYSIVEYLKNNLSYSGINSAEWSQITNLNQLPFPDFSDYDMTQYGEKGIPICDSRGCVRTCEFCDIIEHWKKYQYRSAENIFNEMLFQISKYNITNFFFYNSLTNGNMKEFQKLLDMICDYNSINETAQISWDGYFIIRNSTLHPEELWQKIKKSNGHLQLGIESVIEKVRVNLGKNFTNDDIDYHLTMAKKYSVPLLLLLIIGYPTETLEDFEFTKQWFLDRQDYANNPITQVVLSMAAILPNTQLEKNQQSYNIIKGEIPIVWLTTNTNVTIYNRIQYFDELVKLLTTLKINNNGRNIDTHELTLSKLPI